MSRNPQVEYGGLAQLLRPWSPIIVSNRAPFRPLARGGFRRGSGGLVPALLAVAEATGATWVACAGTDAERALAGRAHRLLPLGSTRQALTLRFVDVDPATYRRHYSVIANPILWFIQHYLWPLAYEPIIDDEVREAWRTGYVPVNQQCAQTVVEVAEAVQGRPLVLTQDYQLYLAPRMIRDRLPEASLQQFIHIPWPTANYWTILPRDMRESIIDGLLANDVVGFQTRRDVRNFLVTCEELMGLRIDFREAAVIHRGRVVMVRAYPVSVDVRNLTRLAGSADVVAEDARLRAWRPEKLIVRVDRTDPSKNIIRGFIAYERMLLRHPEWLGRVQFWAFLQPSRQDVAVYSEYMVRLRSTAARINDSLGRPGWVPIRLQLAESLKTAIAAYKAFDVLLVNPIYDGMNLVAKEGMLLNEADGVLVLSENAGAHEELGADALSINPFDIDATAETLYVALTMSSEERRRRNEAIKAQVRNADVNRWMFNQFRDLWEYSGRSRRSQSIAASERHAHSTADSSIHFTDVL